MDARKLIFPGLAAGVLVGTVAGLATSPVMKQAPARPWHATAGPPSTTAYRFVETGPYDLSPPVGLRHEATYASPEPQFEPRFDPYPLPFALAAEPGAEAETYSEAVPESPIGREIGALEDAAAAEHAARDARSAITAETPREIPEAQVPLPPPAAPAIDL